MFTEPASELRAIYFTVVACIDWDGLDQIDHHLRTIVLRQNPPRDVECELLTVCRCARLNKQNTMRKSLAVHHHGSRDAGISFEIHLDRKRVHEAVTVLDPVFHTSDQPEALVIIEVA